MDTAAHHQWPQESVVAGLVKPMVEMVTNTTSSSNPNNNNNSNTLEQQRKPRPQKEQAINCPRCNSTNTKFCYYNNYSLTQPRYFCKTCRRYWTEGGSLRNVPVGGGSRKNRRSSSSSSILSSKLQNSNINNKLLPSSADNNHLTNPPMIFSKSLSSHQNPKIHETQDLNLAFPTTENYHTISSFVHDLPNIVDHQNNKTNNINSSTTTPSSTSLSALLRSGINNTTTNSRGLSTSYMPTDHSNTVNYSSGFALQDFKPTLNFGIDGLGGGGGYGNLHHDSAGAIHHQQESSGRPLFPFEDLRQVSSTTHHEQFDHQQNRGQGAGDSNGYWSGMLGGGSW